MSRSEINKWSAVTSIVGQPLLAGMYFLPSLCTLLNVKNTVRVKCKIVDTKMYDGEYLCVIDRYSTCVDGRHETFLLATLPIPWVSTPENNGSIII